MRPKNKIRRPAPNINNNYPDYRYPVGYNKNEVPYQPVPTAVPNHNNTSPNFHCYPPAVYSMHGASGNAYVLNNNNQLNANGVPKEIQACAPAPVYVNAPPKPRRTSNVPPTPLMVTGQYQQPLLDVQEAHQRFIQPKNHTKSLGRASGNQFLQVNW